MTRGTELPHEVTSVPRAYTRAELQATTSRRRARDAVATRAVVEMMPGLLVAAEQAHSLTARASAAARSTRGALSGTGALYVHGALDRPPPQAMMWVPRGVKRPARDWLVLTRAAPVPQRSTRHGIEVADPVSALAHLWSVGGAEAARGPTLAALQRRTVTLEQLEDARRAWMRHGDDFADTLEAFAQGAHSYLEYEGLREVFASRDFSHFIRQHPIVARGSRYWIDMYDPTTRTAVEMDGDSYHLPGERRAYDIARDADLATLGILTVRFSFTDVTTRPDWCRRTVLSVLASRGGRRAEPNRAARD